MDYALIQYALNRTIFLEKDVLWFGIYNSYATRKAYYAIIRDAINRICLYFERSQS